jgi:hypothetical protein
MLRHRTIVDHFSEARIGEAGPVAFTGDNAVNERSLTTKFAGVFGARIHIQAGVADQCT